MSFNLTDCFNLLYNAFFMSSVTYKENNSPELSFCSTSSDIFKTDDAILNVETKHLSALYASARRCSSEGLHSESNEASIRNVERTAGTPLA